MLDNLKGYNIVLASNSPRRKELLAGLGINYEVRVLPDISENYPDNLSAEEIPVYIAVEKSKANCKQMRHNDLVITADTVVVCGDRILGKPIDENEACQMLRTLSGKTHQVITGVCLASKERRTKFSVSTDVTFKELTETEIGYYVSTFCPFDKAGAYGIQEWIGHIGVTNISGSFFNVMGLPVQRVYSELLLF